ncbi:MAG: CZB domain-containing protein, partial [Chromatiales bacterium]|nr:CZB domain-containing protein [Chromatiales bacterium]
PEHQNLSGIIQKHYEWREKVFDFIHAAADIEQDFALSPHECDMGRWLKDKGQTQYGGTDAITELDKVHRDLHHQVEKAVNLRTKGKREESIRFFNKLNIEHISHRIAAVLIAADESKIYSEASSTLSIDEHLPEPSAKSENRSKDSE